MYWCTTSCFASFVSTSILLISSSLSLSLSTFNWSIASAEESCAQYKYIAFQYHPLLIVIAMQVCSTIKSLCFLGCFVLYCTTCASIQCPRAGALSNIPSASPALQPVFLLSTTVSQRINGCSNHLTIYAYYFVSSILQ